MQLKPITFNNIFLCFLLIFIGTSSFAQNMVKIKGVVIDAETKEPLPFANIAFAGTSVGTTTDFDGVYSIESQWGTDSLVASYLGYDSKIIKITDEKRQTVDFELVSTQHQLVEVEVTAKKRRYRKRNNPAVELIRKVIKNKKYNRLEAYDYYEHDKYEKVEMDLNNITDKFRERKAFKKIKFIFDFVDTSEVSGKPYLPVYLQETNSKVYYRKEPNGKKEFIEAQKLTNLADYLDDESIATVMTKLYDDINIYNNQIMLLTTNFVSPLAPIAPDFYRFYILDTLEFQGKEVIDLAFIPRNKYDFGFNGNMYITQDTTYRIAKVNLNILKETNLNFVKDVQISQEFAQVDPNSDAWTIVKDNIMVDYNLTKKGMGFFGKRKTIYGNHVFNEAKEDDRYEGENVVQASDYKKKDEAYWDSSRPVQLTQKEKDTYHMIDTLQRVPAFKRALNVVSFLLTGYTTVGPVDIGPVNSFYSFNAVEGFRPRLGGRTNTKFHKKIQLEGYAAYGVKNREPKYQATALYSFNENFEDYPRHYIRVSAERETRFPGQVLRYFSESNFFLSFTRGEANKLLFFRSMGIDYQKETKSNIKFNIGAFSRRQRPIGAFDLRYTQGDTTAILNSVQTTEVSAWLRWSPNAQYWNGKSFQIAMFNKYPIFTLEYRAGIKDVLGGQYNYQKAKFTVFKRFYLSLFGYSNLELESSKIFGKNLPYILLDLPRANQTYAYQIYSFNMMNFLEFASDESITLNYQHFFNGFIVNKIPLFKRLKLREVITFKGVIGRLSDENNPNLVGNEGLPRFDKNADGEPITYPLTFSEPYMEASVGIYNIFKFLRVDVVQRLTHLDHPTIPKLWGVKGLGLRARFKVEF